MMDDIGKYATELMVTGLFGGLITWLWRSRAKSEERLYEKLDQIDASIKKTDDHLAVLERKVYADIGSLSNKVEQRHYEALKLFVTKEEGFRRDETTNATLGRIEGTINKMFDRLEKKADK